MIWEIAGVVGVNPLPFTLRELMWMARSREENVWTKVSHLMASALNANPFLKEHYKPSDLNPYHKQKVESADSVFDAMARDGFTQK